MSYNSRTVTLYRGTTKKGAEYIQKYGLEKNMWATDELRVARSFSEIHSDGFYRRRDAGSPPVILKIEMDESEFDRTAWSPDVVGVQHNYRFRHKPKVKSIEVLE